ncbi:MAG: 4-oxalocrotonate tautomerase family protein [Neisseriaceae bacterium]|nr:4-oxalocrotonate tautomerase family protein [Neisseriaceae bacterium]
MPVVTIDLLKGRDQQTKQAIATEITAVLSQHLGNDPAHIYVVFNEVAPNDWAVGGLFFEEEA